MNLIEWSDNAIFEILSERSFGMRKKQPTLLIDLPPTEIKFDFMNLILFLENNKDYRPPRPTYRPEKKKLTSKEFNFIWSMKKVYKRITMLTNRY